MKNLFKYISLFVITLVMFSATASADFKQSYDENGIERIGWINVLFYSIIVYGLVAILFPHEAAASCSYDTDYGDYIENGNGVWFFVFFGYLFLIFRLIEHFAVHFEVGGDAPI